MRPQYGDLCPQSTRKEWFSLCHWVRALRSVLGPSSSVPSCPSPSGKQVRRGPALMKPRTSNQQRNLSVTATCGWPPKLCDGYCGGDFLFVAHMSGPLQFFLTHLPSPSVSIPPSGAMWPECTQLKVFIMDFCKGMVFQARN